MLVDRDCLRRLWRGAQNTRAAQKQEKEERQGEDQEEKYVTCALKDSGKGGSM
jgi:hypothetical protein